MCSVSGIPSSYIVSHEIWSILPEAGINTLRPGQNGLRFADDTFKRIFLNKNIRISIKISLKFVPKGPLNNNPALVQIMAWRRSGDKPLSEPMMVSLLTHICVTRPQWVKGRDQLLYPITSAGCNYQSFSLMLAYGITLLKWAHGSCVLCFAVVIMTVLWNQVVYCTWIADHIIHFQCYCYNQKHLIYRIVKLWPVKNKTKHNFNHYFIYLGWVHEPKPPRIDKWCQILSQ